MERDARAHVELAIEAHHLAIRHQRPQRASCHRVGDVVHLIRGAIRRNQRPSGDAVHLRTAAISR